ncbi:MAG: hypothetical protein ACPLXP_00510 [Microgenomates group bacterium]
MVLSLFIGLVLFFLFLFFFIFVPGAAIFHFFFVKVPQGERLTLSLGIGVAIFTFLSFWLNIFHLRWLVIIYAFALLIYFLRKKIWKEFIFKKPDKIGLLLVFLGGLFQSSLLLKSGITQKEGIVFWGVNGYDGIWHAALIAEINRGFPYQNPGFAGYLLKNYHFLSDLFLVQVHFLTKIPILDLYFRFSPLFFALLLNALVYLFALRWNKHKSVAYWSIFFVSFASTFGWLLPFFGKGSNNWETAFWGAPTSSAFLNPPFGVSLVIILTALILLDLFLVSNNKKIIPILAIILGGLVGFKSYGALVIFVTLGILGLRKVIKEKEIWLLLILFLSGVISLGIYWKSNIEGGNFLIWKPWWFIRTMIEASDRVNWVDFEMRRQAYLFLGEKYKVFLFEVCAFLIFLVGNLGTKAAGLLSFPKILKRNNFLDKFLVVVSVVSFLPTLLFIQKGVAWNTIQFFYYFIFFFSFLAALAVSEILEKISSRWLKLLLIFILIGSSLPSAIKTFWWYNAPTPTTILERREKEGLDFLRKNSLPQSIILTYPYEENKKKWFSSPPIPLTYYNSSYVSFFSNRRVFLEDQNAANILGYPLEERLSKVKEFFQAKDNSAGENFLLKEGIDYIYLVDDQMAILEQRLPISEIFNNGKVRIFRVNKIK